jgi:hypothetical protein
MEGLLRQPDHDGGVFTDGIQHHGTLKFGGDFAHDLDAFGFQGL